MNASRPGCTFLRTASSALRARYCGCRSNSLSGDETCGGRNERKDGKPRPAGRDASHAPWQDCTRNLRRLRLMKGGVLPVLIRMAPSRDDARRRKFIIGVRDGQERTSVTGHLEALWF